MENKDVRLIDANALLQTLSDLCSDAYNLKTRRIVDIVLHDLMPQIISNEPTVDAQPVKRGKWVKYPSIYRCSNCGNPKGMPKPYCELCGARMSDHFANASKMVEEVNEDEQTQ